MEPVTLDGIFELKEETAKSYSFSITLSIMAMKRELPKLAFIIIGPASGHRGLALGPIWKRRHSHSNSDPSDFPKQIIERRGLAAAAK